MRKLKYAFGLLAILALTSCQAGGLVTETVYVPTSQDGDNTSVQEYSYSNTALEGPTVDPKDGIIIDGYADEDTYNEKNWLSLNYDPGNGNPIPMNMCLFTTDNGLFFYFDFADPQIYVTDVDTRPANNDTGIELYLAFPERSDTYYNLYEYHLCPTGRSLMRIQTEFGFRNYVKPTAISPLTSTRIIGNGGNKSSDNEGYALEVYMPWEYFGRDEAPSRIDFHPSIVRSFDDTSDDRLWYDFASDYRNGFSWGNTGSFWHANKDGLEAIKVKTNIIGDGVVDAKKGTVAVGDDATIAILPNDGSRIKTVKVNGTDVTDQLYFDGENNYYRIISASIDINMDVEFEKVPTEKGTISGTITEDGAKMVGQTYTDLGISFFSGGAVYNGEITSGGKYSITAPIGVGRLILSSIGGNYIIEQINGLELTSGSPVNKNFDLNASNYGEYRHIKYEDTYNISSGYRYVYKPSDTYYTTSLQRFHIKFNGSFFNADGSINNSPSGGTVPNELYELDIRSDCWFLSDDGKTPSAYSCAFQFQVLHWNTSWLFKLVFEGQQNFTTPIAVSQLKAMETTGLDIALDFRGDSFDVYTASSDDYYPLISGSGTQTRNRVLVNTYYYVNNPMKNTNWEITDAYIQGRKNEDPFPGNIKGKVVYADNIGTSKVTSIYKGGSDPLNVAGMAFKWQFYFPGIKSGEEYANINNLRIGYRMHLYTDKAESNWTDIEFHFRNDGSKYYITGGHRQVQEFSYSLTAAMLKNLTDTTTSGLQMLLVRQGADYEYYVSNCDGTYTKLFTGHNDDLASRQYMKFIDIDCDNNTPNIQYFSFASVYGGLEGSLQEIFNQFK